MISFLIVVVFIGAGGAFLHQAKFGHSPSGERLKRIEHSPNFRNGSFQNQLPTPMMKEDVSVFSVAKDFLFDRSSRSRPPSVLPTVKIN
ncbi:MAG TPA: MBL fold metallo-hydrolase, partial [Bacteroidota bacterium]|nr:MBL fold metallo-hydrolase [Bacteroidota bacterium]